ncbi:uncharacterized protein LOC114580617 [Dendrobium catenatum]|uniref:uncharacterized protein LOC114580617 n=1 Tax=Dendrobium catenatum TaxID=906689 RepID=UPI00109FDC90|nr:uncharacterized protein LOC114580617 [Dendrobium catenatum]
MAAAACSSTCVPGGELFVRPQALHKETRSPKLCGGVYLFSAPVPDLLSWYQEPQDGGSRFSFFSPSLLHLSHRNPQPLAFHSGFTEVPHHKHQESSSPPSHHRQLRHMENSNPPTIHGYRLRWTSHR